MKVVCLDLEGVLLPEIWKKIAEETGVEELKLTTREMPDYEKLMEKRFKHLRENSITINEIREILFRIEPLPGAEDFLDWLRERTNVSILTGSFYQFLLPLIVHFNWPMILAKDIKWDEDGYLEGFYPKNHDLKVEAIETFRSTGLKTLAIGDSFNDVEMLKKADMGILFNPSRKVKNNSVELPMVSDYEELKEKIRPFLNGGNT